MLAEFAIVGGVTLAVVGLLEVSARLDGASDAPTPEAAIREAMRGPEAPDVRAEFRRSGIEPPRPERTMLLTAWTPYV